MAWWARFASAGKELEVAEEIRGLGLTCHCAVRLHTKRVSRKRKFEAFDAPLWPNILFVNAPDERFHDVDNIKGLWRTGMLLSQRQMYGFHSNRTGEWRGGVMDDLRRAQEAYTAALRKFERQDYVCPYVEGQRLDLDAEGWEGQVAKFVRMVQQAHDDEPRLRVALEMMGREIQMDVPVDKARAAE